MDIIWRGRNGFSDGPAASWRPMLGALMSSRREQLAAGAVETVLILISSISLSTTLITQYAIWK